VLVEDVRDPNGVGHAPDPRAFRIDIDVDKLEVNLLAVHPTPGLTKPSSQT